MSRIPVIRVIIFLLALVLSVPCFSYGQRTYGVSWDVPDDMDEAIQQLERFEKLKIRTIELDEIVADPLWEEINRRNFDVYVQVPIRYPVIQVFLSPDSATIETYQQFISRYTEREIEAIGIFAYGQTQHRAFADAVRPYIEQMQSSLSLPVYFKDWNYGGQPVDQQVDFRMVHVEVGRDFRSLPDTIFQGSNVFLYQPTEVLSNKVTPLKWFFEKTSVNPEATLFFDSEWLLSFIENHQPVSKILAEHATYADAVFPLPREELPSRTSHSPIVLILVLLWGIVGLSYNFIPMYKRSLFRFFLNHKFFIEDVMQRHIREQLPSLVLLFQHTILGGIFLYSVAFTYLSEMGVDIFFFYFNGLSLFGSGYFSFFFLGCFFTLAFEVISLLWLYLANKKVGYLSQISILYSWPFHLNLIIGTIIVTLIMSGGSSQLLTFFFILFLLVILSNFPITAYDTGKKIVSKKWLYVTGTMGIYYALLVIVLVAIFTNDYLWNVLDLAVSIT